MLSVAERHKYILDHLNKYGFVRITDVANELGVTKVTIRKDVKILEAKGLLYKVHGSARSANPHVADTDVHVKGNVNREEKERIARKAVELLNDNDSIIMASGSTIYAFAEAIKREFRSHLNVVTTFLKTSVLLNDVEEINVVQLGGCVHKKSLSAIGGYAEAALSDFSCSKLFFGVDGIDLEHGITTSTIEEAKLTQVMMRSASKIIILADSSKFGQRGFGRICSLEEIDVIVTDHHLPGPELPRAVSIVNPNRADSVFPSKNLAGVGVIYYVLLALRALLRERGVYDAKTQPRLDQLVDFVALGTVADVVKLDKNNRILVSQGLRRIRSGRTHAGLEALFAIAGKDTHTAGVRDFGFAVAPRINAAGRLGTMESGIECLLSDDPSRALAFADNLNSINAERRELEGEMQQAAEAALEAVDLDHRATFSLYNPDFNEGVVGLVAARLKERIHRPVIAFAPTENHELKGSGRSIPGIHLRDMIDLVSKALPGVVIRFGGHAMAAGLSIRPRKSTARSGARDLKRRFLRTNSRFSTRRFSRTRT